MSDGCFIRFNFFHSSSVQQPMMEKRPAPVPVKLKMFRDFGGDDADGDDDKDDDDDGIRQ